jgi:hypothetical protein
MAKKWALTCSVSYFSYRGYYRPSRWLGNRRTEVVSFMTDTVHDWVHLVSGLICVHRYRTCSASAMLSRHLDQVLGIDLPHRCESWGFFASPVLGFINVNMADNILHLVLGVVILWAGIATKHEVAAAPMSAPTQM